MSSLEDLLVVQGHDTVLDQLRHRRAALPERTAVQEIDATLKTLGQEHARAVAARDEVAGRQATLEKDIAASEARIAEIDRRMYSGEISASRDLQAMAAEIASIKARVSTLEDRALEVMDEREPLDATVVEIQAKGTALVAERERLLTVIAETETAIDADIEVEASARATSASSVPVALLENYEKLRSRLGDTGVARLEHGTCMGCHMKMPATELDRIRHQPPEVIVNCEQCGRILVRTG